MEHSYPNADTTEYRLIASEQLIGRIRAEQLRMIGQLESQQVALMDGCKSMTEWLSGRADMSTSTARRLVSASHRAADRPAMLEELDRGSTTFERAEAALRLGGELSVVEHLDIAGINRLAARRQAISSHDEQTAYERRHLTLQPTLDNMGGRLWGELVGVDFTTVQDVLIATAEQFPAESRSDGRSMRNADALVAICQKATSTGPADESGTSPGNQAQLTVFIDVADRHENGYVPGGPVIGPNSIDELICGGASIDIFSTDEHGRPLDPGRKTAKISPRLRRFVLGRDDGCCAAGCTSRYRLQAHHRIHWADGGPTNAENLVSLCWFHHHVVIHQRGYDIDPDSPSRRLRFRQPPSRAPS